MNRRNTFLSLNKFQIHSEMHISIKDKKILSRSINYLFIFLASYLQLLEETLRLKSLKNQLFNFLFSTRFSIHFHAIGSCFCFVRRVFRISCIYNVIPVRAISPATFRTMFSRAIDVFSRA